MDVKCPFYRSLNFWIISFIVSISLVYTVFSEIFPIDWFMTSASFNNNEKYIYKKSFLRLAILNQSVSHLPYDRYREDPELLFEKVSHVFKDRPTKTRVALAQIGGRRYVVKQYRVPSFYYWCKAVPLRASKGYRAWYYSNEFHELGMNTAKPLMFIEKKVGPFWTSSYLVFEYIDGIPATEYFSPDSPFKNNWNETLLNLKKSLSLMNDNLMIQADLTLNNIIVLHKQVYFIDLDRVHHYHFDHTFYKRRLSSQHYEKLSRKLGEINPEAQALFHKVFNLPQDMHKTREGFLKNSID